MRRGKQPAAFWEKKFVLKRRGVISSLKHEMKKFSMIEAGMHLSKSVKT